MLPTTLCTSIPHGLRNVRVLSPRFSRLCVLWYALPCSCNNSPKHGRQRQSCPVPTLHALPPRKGFDNIQSSSPNTGLFHTLVHVALPNLPSERQPPIKASELVKPHSRCWLSKKCHETNVARCQGRAKRTLGYQARGRLKERLWRICAYATSSLLRYDSRVCIVSLSSKVLRVVKDCVYRYVGYWNHRDGEGFG